MVHGRDEDGMQEEEEAMASPEPAQLVEYELQRQDNLRRIEEAKRAFLSAK